MPPLQALQNSTWAAGHKEPGPCLPPFKTLHMELFSHSHGLREACPSSSRIHTLASITNVLINVSFWNGLQMLF